MGSLFSSKNARLLKLFFIHLYIVSGNNNIYLFYRDDYGGFIKNTIYQP